MMKILYLDCFSGFDVQMLLGALLSLGANINSINEKLKSLFPSVSVNIENTLRCGIEASYAHLDTDDNNIIISVNELDSYVSSVCAEDGLKSLFNRILLIYKSGIQYSPQKAENIKQKDVINFVAFTAAVYYAQKELGADYVICSRILCGSGIDENNRIIPSPLTMEILKSTKIPSKGTDMEIELTNAQNAAFLGAFANEYGPMPEMDIIKIGYGAGEKELEIPNLIRAVLGNTNDTPLAHIIEKEDILAEITEEIFAMN